MDNRTDNQISEVVEETVDRKQKLNYILIAVIGIVLLTGVAVFIVVRFMQSKPADASQTTERTNAQTEYSLIYDENISNLVSLVPCSDCVAVVEKNQIVYLNKDGMKLSSSTHDYSDPKTAEYGMEVLLYDRGAKTYRIEKNTSVYGEYTAESEILTAAVGKKGNYAIATLNDGGYRSKLYVYDASGKLQFEWGSAHDYISRIALSDNGQNVAVALFGSENAVSYTRLYLFDFMSNEPVFTDDYKNINCVALDFMHGNELTIVTDCSVLHIEDDMISTWMEYGASSLLSVAVQHAERISVLTSGADGTVNLNVWDKNGKSVLSMSVGEQLRRFVMSDGYFCLADSVSGFVCNEAGVQTADFDIPGLVTFCIAGKRVFAATEKGIFCYPLHTVTTQTLSIIKTGEPQAKSEKKQTESMTTAAIETIESDDSVVG